MELVDVGDSKSPGSDTVSVRVRPEALNGDSTTVGSFFSLRVYQLQCHTCLLYTSPDKSTLELDSKVTEFLKILQQ